MSIQTDSRIASTAEELVVTRDFDAPRGLVFKAWTDPAQLMRQGIAPIERPVGHEVTDLPEPKADLRQKSTCCSRSRSSAV